MSNPNLNYCPKCQTEFASPLTKFEHKCTPVPIPFSGFDRVIINKDGLASTVKRAYNDIPGYSVTIGFLRDDGWALGAPEKFERIAWAMWNEQWTHFIRKGEKFWRPISEYENKYICK